MWTRLTVAIVVGLVGVSAVEAVAQDGTPAVSTEIAAELAGLSSQDFKTREQAMRQLAARRLEVIAPLGRLASAGNTEASIRAFELLRRIYREGDSDAHEAIETELEGLMRSEDLSVVARAESAVEDAAPIRHARAIAAFRELGGIIRFQTDEERGEQLKEESRSIKYAMLNHTWKGGDDGVKYLRRIEDFRIQTEFRGAPLYVTPKCPISKEALQGLQTSLPLLPVHKRGPACLGISPYAAFGGPAGLQIASVELGSAADRAGLKVGDFILKFNGFETPDFETLVEKIGEKLPGDKVSVVIERDNTEQTVVVELRSW